MILDGDKDALGLYVRDIADMMGLRDWTLILAVRPESEMDECAGTCAVHYGRKMATITFAEGWEDRDPEDMRQLTAHELVHCHTEQMTTVVAHLRQFITDSKVSEFAEETYRVAMEHAVDGIARSWAESLPLPVKKKTLAIRGCPHCGGIPNIRGESMYCSDCGHAIPMEESG